MRPRSGVVFASSSGSTLTSRPSLRCATFQRLRLAADPLPPEAFLALGDDDLRGVGFSRQKAIYGQALAGALVGGTPASRSSNRSPTRRRARC
ncbi:MAG: hypothetical protein EA416_01315 [Trueperaceae bacterium]|nr:MAG: hypothetical protein EA416_01315 [Trueperaceae bacterium]